MALFHVHPPTSRDGTDADVALVEEAERSWAAVERVHAANRYIDSDESRQVIGEVLGRSDTSKLCEQR